MRREFGNLRPRLRTEGRSDGCRDGVTHPHGVGGFAQRTAIASARIRFRIEILVRKSVVQQTALDAFDEFPRLPALVSGFVAGEARVYVVVGCQPIIRTSGKTARPLSLDFARTDKMQAEHTRRDSPPPRRARTARLWPHAGPRSRPAIRHPRGNRSASEARRRAATVCPAATPR